MKEIIKPIQFTKKEIQELTYQLTCAQKLSTGTNKKIITSILKKVTSATKNKKRISVTSAKAKGRTLQYKVCEVIAHVTKTQFIQSDDNCLIHSREMGQHGTDIVLRGWIGEKLPYDIECKACEQLNIPQWIEQARANTKEGRVWTLIVKKQSIKETIAIIPIKEWMRLIKGRVNE